MGGEPVGLNRERRAANSERQVPWVVSKGPRM